MDQELHTEIDEFIESNWENVVNDIDELVQIPSFEELDKAADGAPFGPGPRAALDKAMELASAMGFDSHDCEGYLAYADYPGESDTQIGIICHTDVVPAGPGWNFDPYKVTRKDGYLIGRGTLDDKGPLVVALYAMKFWKDRNTIFPYTIRYLFGANEESGMADIEYFHKHFEDPAFLFTPDAEFPVCYGEKGGFDATITSKLISDGTLVEFEGGSATNAVPGFAHAVVKVDPAVAADLKDTDRVTITPGDNGTVRIDAKGKSAHAATPEEGVSAIGLVVDYLLDNDLVDGDERAFLQFDQKLLNHTDGSGVGIKCEDEYFGPLTVIGGTVNLEDGRIVQTLDSRWPTTITPEGITKAITSLTDPLGATFENTLLMEPFLVKPDEPTIQALLSAYNEATGENAKPFTMGGGTYAREFKSGASFGVEMPWLKNPEWVGSMHGPDEGISEDQLKKSLRIYILTLQRLMELDLA